MLIENYIYSYYCELVKSNSNPPHMWYFMFQTNWKFIFSTFVHDSYTERKNGVILTWKVESLVEQNIDTGFQVIGEYLN